MKLDNQLDRIRSGYQLLEAKNFSYTSFQDTRKLIAGLNPAIDQKLSAVSKVWQEVRKYKKDNLSQTMLKSLPEDTKEDKKRKKLLLLLFKNYRSLKSEVNRVQKELNKAQYSADSRQTMQSTSKLISTAKGPWGIITLTAAIIVGGITIFSTNKSPTIKEPPVTQAVTASPLGVQVIQYEAHQIPLDELRIGLGGECLTNGQPAEHYHPVNPEGATSLSGEIVADPNPTGCGFGKDSEIEVNQL